MKTYIVGGAVRDQLLGLPVSDRDHVVVGATPQQMIAAGFKPVGLDFPVFLHPLTHEEYALARTERKVARGYAGFNFQSSPEVTLEQDLARRDLTINAMALAEDGSIIDPYGGQADLRAKCFRHVSAAFAEDPVRILRTARFAARLVDFELAAETLALMRKMANDGEVDALIAERVWQELSRGLMHERPSRMVQLLLAADTWQRLAPELNDLPALNTSLRALDVAASQSAGLPVRFAVLMSAATGSAATRAAKLDQICRRWRVPGECRDLAVMMLTMPADETVALPLPAQRTLQMLEQLDAFRRPERFLLLLQVMSMVWSKPWSGPLLAHLQRAHQRAAAVDTAALALAIQRSDAESSPAMGPRIKAAVHEARLAAVIRATDEAHQQQSQGL